jgi:hypothetical protein
MATAAVHPHHRFGEGVSACALDRRDRRPA